MKIKPRLEKMGIPTQMSNREVKQLSKKRRRKITKEAARDEE
jgi:hypothetical protein